MASPQSEAGLCSLSIRRSVLQTHPRLEESRSLQQLIKFYQSVSVTFSTSTFTTLLFVFRLQIRHKPNPKCFWFIVRIWSVQSKWRSDRSPVRNSFIDRDKTARLYRNMETDDGGPLVSGLSPEEPRSCVCCLWRSECFLSLMPEGEQRCPCHRSPEPLSCERRRPPRGIYEETGREVSLPQTKTHLILVYESRTDRRVLKVTLREDTLAAAHCWTNCHRRIAGLRSDFSESLWDGSSTRPLSGLK